MSVSLWNIGNGQELKKLVEGTTVNVILPVASSYEIDTEVISGNLPEGLTLTNNVISGTVAEVAIDTVYRFVIRAYWRGHFDDRTLNLVVRGPDVPEWGVDQGLLPVGPNETYFILDNEIIDFQLIATDPDTVAGDVLEYYIADGDGVLPPGVSLSKDGRLTGTTEPLLSLDKRFQNGGFDAFPFGDAPSDFGARPSNGFSSFLFDTQPFDFFTQDNIPKKLNRYYPFAVTVSDGINVARRSFKIYVVGDDFLTADNILMEASTGVFRADNTNVRTPIWITPRDLGFRRANNYTTIYLDVIDTDTVRGVVTYTLENLNDDGSVSTLPPGLTLSSFNGEVSGTLPYQPAVTREYKFTVNASRYAGGTSILTLTLYVREDTMLGSTKIKVDKTVGDTPITDLIGRNIFVNTSLYKVIGINTSDQNFDEIILDSPIGVQESLVTLNQAASGQAYVDVKPISQRLKDFYVNKTLTLNNTSLNIIDFRSFITYEIDSEQLPAATPNDLVTAILVDYPNAVPSVKVTSNNTWELTLRDTNYTRIKSDIENIIQATVPYDSAAPTVTLKYDRFDRITFDNNLTGILNSDTNIGLSLVKGDSISSTFNSSTTNSVTEPRKSKTFVVKILGEIDSSINWITQPNLGTIKTDLPSLITVEAETTVPNIRMIYRLTDGAVPDGTALSYRGDLIGTPTTAGTYNFTVEARDRFNVVAITQEFTLIVEEKDSIEYTDIVSRPMLPLEKRKEYSAFIRDPDIFPQELVYRANDPNFGLRSNIEVLIYAGIEQKAIDLFVSAAAKNHKRKKYKLGQPTKAIAKQIGTNDAVYEVIYVPVIDPAESESGKTKKIFNIKTKNKLTVDSVQYAAMDDNTRLGQGLSALPVYGREVVKFVFEKINDSIVIQTRDSNIRVSTDNSDFEVEVRAGGDLTVKLEKTESDPIRLRPKANTIKADSDAVKISQNTDSVKYISSIEHMRDNIKSIGQTSLEYLPLWMRTPQTGYQALGYVSAIPLCFCLPGKGDEIIERIKESTFNFKQLNIELDRYIITNTEDGTEKFVLFANYQFNV
jgi:hypothetical protein